ncbi:MAG: hypothetical protein NXI24_05645 [bacterium]|nr:hypothetical protein [bacterium]
MLISETIRLFLDSIGRSEEYEYYLKKFRSDRSSCFAVLCPDEDACQRGGENLGVALQYLQRLDLVPAVLLTGPRAEEMRRALTHNGLAITTFRPKQGRPPAGFGAADSGGGADSNRAAKPGDEVELVVALGAAVQQARSQKKSLAIVWEQESLLDALQFLSRQLSSRVYLIRMAGALRGVDSEELLYYHYRNDSSRSGILPADEAVAELATAVGQSVEKLHLSVTAPYNLIKEIFTVKGAGTMVRAGSNIQRHRGPAGIAAIDRERLFALLGQSFQKQLVDESFLERASDIYLEENYQGAIILESRPMGSYLSKFAVDKQARGLGIAQELWELAIHEHSALFWRSRHNNSINRWYASLADGTHFAPPHWNIFWRGVALADIPRIIEFCTQRPEDFVSV